MIEDLGISLSETVIDTPEADQDSAPVLLAQADIGAGQAGSNQSGSAPAGGTPGIAVIIPDADNRVTLAATASIEEIQLDGDDLLLIQPDGSQIRIIGGATDVPTFVIGEIEVPQEVLVAALNSNGFNVAAGPGNTLSVSPQAPTGSGGEFEGSSGASIAGDGLRTLGLLDDTSLSEGGGEAGELQDEGNIASVVTGGALAGGIVESADNPGGIDADPVAARGSIFFFDPDFGESRAAEISGRTVSSQVLNGRASLTEAQLDALLAGFSLDTPGGITVESTSAAGGSINWTYFVNNSAVDFLSNGETITLSFDVRIIDGILSTIQTVTITVSGTNDAPFISNVTNSSVQEDDLAGGTSPSAALLTATGTFGIDWGADFGDGTDTADVGGAQDTPTGLGNRSLTFADIDDQPTQPTTSDGVAIQYVLSAGNTVLTAYKGEGRSNGDKVFEVSLSDDGTGSYKFVLLGNIDHDLPGPGEKAQSWNLDFRFIATDAGGDTDTATFTVTINDDAPIASNVSASTVLDDEGQTLFAGNDSPADGVGNVKVVSGEAGSLFTMGADGLGSIVLTPPAFSVVARDAQGFAQAQSVSWDAGARGEGGVTTWTATSASYPGGAAVLVIRADGSYTFTLNAPVAHVATASGESVEENLTLGFGFVVTDGDGDTAAGNLSVNVNDDAPLAVAAVATAVLDDEAQSVFTPTNPGGLLDVSPDVKTVSGGAGSLFSMGADGLSAIALKLPSFAVVFKDVQGFAQTQSVSWGEGVRGEGGVTTWTATSANYPDGAAVLVIRADGSYTFTLNAPVAHGTSLPGIEENASLDFVFTVTDGDGDTASGSLHIEVDDDTPRPIVSVVSAPAILDDEAQSVFTPANPGGGSFGSDVSPDVKTVSGGAESLFSMGADGLGTISLALPAFDVVFKDTQGFAQTQSVSWSAGIRSEGGTTTWTATSASYPDGAAVLVIRADGSYTFTLNAPVKHFADLLGVEENLPLNIGYAMTDGDGDGAVGLLTIQVNDDRPVAGNVTPSTFLDDEAQTLFAGNDTPADGIANVNVVSGGAGTLFSMGADGLRAISVTPPAFSVVFKDALGFAQTESVSWDAGVRSAGGVTTWTATSTNYPGSAAVLVIRADGSYSFTLNAPVAHAPSQAGEGNARLDFNYRVTDGDGDAASARLRINVNDDAPLAANVTASTVLDDEAQALFAGNNTPADGVANVANATGGAGSLFSMGSDGLGTIAITGPVFSVIWKDANGVAHTEGVTWGAGVRSADGVTTWTATSAHYGPGTSAATLTIKADGSYSFTLNAPFAHAATAGATGVEENATISFGFTVRDGDGDTATGTLNINVNDDAPNANIVAAVSILDDEAQSVFIPANNGGVLDVSPDIKTVSGGAGSLFTAGADGFGSVSVNPPAFAVVYKDAQGFAQTESVSWNAGVTVGVATTWTATSTGYPGGAAVLVVNADGSYAFTLNAPVAHGTALPLIEENATLDFGFTVTDGDGDTTSGSLAIRVNDDTPTSTLIVIPATVLDDEAQSTFLPANNGGFLDVSPNVKTVSGGAGALFSMGADGLGAIALNLPSFNVIFKDTLGFAQSESVSWGSGVRSENGTTTWTATSASYPGGAAVLVVKADGSYSFTLNAPVDHAVALPLVEENAFLNFGYTVTDGDGDGAAGLLTIRVNDDTPTASNVTPAAFDDEAQFVFLPANTGGTDDVTPDIRTISGNPGALFSMGSDGLGSISVGMPSFSIVYKDVNGFAQTQSVSWSAGVRSAEGTTTWTATSTNYPSGRPAAVLVIKADGSYSFSLYAPVVHPSHGSSEENVNLDFNYTVTDGDGDTAAARLRISVDDDRPSSSGTVTAATILDDEAQTLFAGNNTPADGVANIATATGGAGSLFSMGSDGLGAIAVTGPAFSVIWKDANGVGHSEAVTWDAGVRSAGGVTTWTATGAHYGSATPAATLTINADGSYGFTLNAPFAHTATAGTTGVEENATISFGFTVTDGDGDTATGTLNLNVNDDAPVSTGTVMNGSVFENEAAGGTDFDNSDDDNGDGLGNDSVLVGNLSSLVSVGADGVGAYLVETTDLSRSLTSLTSGGVALVFGVSGNTLIASAGVGGPTIFTFAVDQATGAFTFTQVGPLDHVETLLVGETVIPPSALNVVGAIQSAPEVNGADLHFMGRLPNGDAIIRVTNDGNSAVNWTLDNKSQSGTDYPLTIAAHTSVFINVGQIGGVPPVQFQLTGTGAPNGVTTVNNGHGDGVIYIDGRASLTLDLSSAITVRDGDGDTVALDGQLNIIVRDDAPIAYNILAPSILDDDAFPGGNLGGLDDWPDVTSVSGAAGALFKIGTDGFAAISLDSFSAFKAIFVDASGVGIQQTVNVGAPVSAGGTTTWTFSSANIPTVATLTINADGSYTLTTFAPVVHPYNGLSEDGIEITFAYTVTDGDGDTASGSLLVNINDDTPTVGTVETGAVTENEILLAITNGSFQSDSLAAGAPGVNVHALGNHTVTAPTGWTLSNGGTFDPIDPITNPAGPSGTNVAWLHSGATLAQTTSNTIVAGASYKLAFDFGDRADQDWSGGQARLVAVHASNPPVVLASIDLTDPGNGQWAHLLLNTGPVGAVYAGWSLRIEIQQTGASDIFHQIMVDAVQLSMIPPITDSGSLGISWGADGIGSLAFDAAFGATVPLFSHGQQLAYALSNGGTLLTATAGGRIVFTLALDQSGSGTWTYTQFDALDHDISLGSDRGVAISFGFVATDGDGDKATGNISITVTDDTPVVGAVTSSVTLNENDLAAGTDATKEPLQVTGNLVVDLGIDGGTIALSAAGATWSVAAKTLTANDGSWHVTLNGDGTYTFTLDDNSLLHSAATAQDTLSIIVSYAATDGDFDVASGSFTVNIVDDAPVLTGTLLNGTVYESETTAGTAFGNADDKNSDGGGNDSVLTGNLSSLVNFGADGVGAYTVETTNLSPSLTSLTSGGVALVYSVSGNTLTAKAGAAGPIVFTFSVDQATGAYTFTQIGKLDHVDKLLIGDVGVPAGSLDNPGNTYAVAETGGALRSFEGRMTDGDAVIQVTNSGNSQVTWTLDNEAGGTDYVLIVPAHTTVFVNVGNVANGTHFSVVGQPGQTTVNSGHAGNIVAVSGSAALVLDMSSAVTVSDGDGDAIALSGQLKITLNDDVPVVFANADVQLDDETLANGVPGGTGDADPGTANTTGTLGHNFGGDGGSIAWLTTGNPMGFTYQLSGSTLLIKQGAVTVVTVTLNPATGEYTVTQNAAVKHPAGGDENDQSFTLGYRVTDGDGDTANGTLSINVDDDMPFINGALLGHGAVDEERLPTGNAGDSYGDGGDMSAVQGDDGDLVATGNLGISYGADCPAATIDGPLTFDNVASAVANISLTDSLDNSINPAALTSNGQIVSYALLDAMTLVAYTGSTVPATIGAANVVFSVVLSSGVAGGSYTFTLKGNLDHPIGGTEDDFGFNFSYAVKDSDGDRVIGAFHVTVNDDAPATTGAVTAGNVSEYGLPLVQFDFHDLNIKWGADGKTYGNNPHLEFASTAITDAHGDPLTTGGAAIAYTLVPADGSLSGLDQKLVAYLDGTDPNDPGNWVFSVNLTGPGNAAYQFLLLKPLDHLGLNDASLAINFTVNAFDSDGDSVTQTFTVNVADDVPLAVKDDAVSFDEDSGVHSGNVMTNDIQGADGATMTKVTFDAGTTWHVIATEGVNLGGGVYSFTLPGVGVYTFTATGDWTFTMAQDFNGQTTFAYIITDGDGDESDPEVTIENTLVINVTAFNDAPVINGPITQAAVEDVPLAITGLSITDVDAGSGTVSVGLTITNGTISLASTAGLSFVLGDGIVDSVMAFSGTLASINAAIASISYLPNANFSGTGQLTLNVSDNGNSGAGGPLTDSHVIDITVDPVSDIPALSVSNVSTFEDTPGAPLVINANVTDHVGNSETIIGYTISNVVNGTLSAGTNNGGGVWTLTPAQMAGLAFLPTANFGGTVVLTVVATAQDGSAAPADSAPQMLTVEIVPVADAPILTALSSGGDEDTAIPLQAVSAGLVDLDGSETLAVTLSGIPVGSHLSAGVNAFDATTGIQTAVITGWNFGALTITPPANFNGSFDLILTATATESGNGDVASSTQTISVVVDPVNDVPVAVFDTGTMTEDAGTAIFNVGANDTLDPDAGAPNNITLGTISISPNSLGIDVSDLLISVTPDNRIQVQLLGTDWDKLSNGASLGVSINYVLHGDLPTDNSGNQLSLLVTGVNDAPVLITSASPSMSVSEDALAPIGAVGSPVSSLLDFSSIPGGLDNVSDPDGLVLGIAVTGLNSSNGTWYWSPNNGSSWITFNPVSPANALLLYSNYLVYFKPAADFNGTISDAITFHAWDRSSGTPGQYVDATINGGTTSLSVASDTVSLTVTPVNDHPVITGVDNASIAENQPGALIDSFNVADVDTASGLSFRVLNGTNVDPRFEIVAASGTTFGQPGTYELRLIAGQSFDYETETSVTRTIEVNDGAGANNIATAPITITVTDVNENHAPVASYDSLPFGPTAPSGTGWALNAANGHYYKVVNTALTWDAAKLASENAGGYLVTITSSAEATFVNGIMTPNNFYWLGGSDAATEGTWQWVTGPEAGSTFWTQVSYTPGGSSTGTTAPGFYTSWGGGNPANGEPNNGFFGSGNEDYLLARSDGWWNDGTGTSGAQGYIMEWSGLSGGAVSEDAPKTFSTALLLANDTDVDVGDVLSVTGLGPSNLLTMTTAKGATVTLNTVTGEITYNATGAAAIQALNVGQTTTDSFTYWISDGHGGSSSAIAALTVNGANDAAVITGVSTGTVLEAVTGGSVGTPTATGDLNSTDIDNTADAWTVVSSAATSTNGYGSYVIDATGHWTYTLNNTNSTVNALNNGQTLTDTFTVSTVDGTPKLVTVTINGATDPSLPVTANTYAAGQSGAGNSTGAAFNLNGSGVTYLKSNDPDIENADTRPSISVTATTTNNQTDYYRLTVGQNGTQVWFDIDHSNFDNWIRLLASNGSTVLAQNDDNPNGIDAGSSSGLDSFLSVTLNAGTYYLQVGRFNPATSSFGSFGASNETYELHVSIVPPAGDPIVLDLGNPGISLTSLQDGVLFDINGDGAQDQVAWTNGEDGLLVMDLDASGNIEDGREVFSPVFGGGNYVDGLDALATLDTNGDGVIDGADQMFGSLQLWQDVNHNGVVEAGELRSLTDHGIASISLNTTPTSQLLDGQQLLATGSFTFDDGSVGSFIEVDFDKFIAPQPDALSSYQSLSDLSGDDVLRGGLGRDTLIGGAGADTFVFDTVALADAGAGILDLLADYNFSEGDVIDLSALLGAEAVTTSNTGEYIRTDGNFLSIDIDGAANGESFVAIAEFAFAPGHDALRILVDDTGQPSVTI